MMPSKSPSQHRLMDAAAHTSGGYGGVSQKVGQDFAGADKRKAHMQRRKDHGLTYQQLASEFSTSKSTAHRKLKSNALRQGFNKMGSAK